MPSKIVLAGNLPEGWQGTPQELLEIFASLMRVEGDDSVAGTVTYGPTEPSSHADLWIDTSDPRFTRVLVYNDQYARWLPAYDLPVGAVIMSAPSGIHVSTIDGRPDWLVCDGAMYQAADYPELYDFLTNLTAASEPTWGPLIAAGGATAFCVPDLRGRVPVGAGTGQDYASNKEALTERIVGSKGTDVEGDKGDLPPSNHPGYPGHDFIYYAKRPYVGAATKPIQQMVSLTSPAAQIAPTNTPAYGASITAVLPSAAVLNFLIKAR